MQQGVNKLARDVAQFGKITKLAETKAATPYGVIYTASNGQRVRKMFESVETREYWVGLHTAKLTNAVMIEPSSFDNAIAAAKKE